MNIKLQSLLQVQVNRFWPSGQSNESIQAFSSNCFIEKMRESSKYVILSTFEIKKNEIKNVLKVRNVIFTLLELALNIEEADLQIIPHLHKTVTEDCKRVIVSCNNTDVLALLLYYIDKFMSNGLTALWIKFGTGSSSKLHCIF